MTITKEVQYDKTEIIGDYKEVHCTEVTIIKEDGVELSRSVPKRHILHPDSDISGETQETQDICNAVWTDEVKAAWTAYMAEQTPE
jgi:hypothetical protein